MQSNILKKISLSLEEKKSSTKTEANNSATSSNATKSSAKREPFKKMSLLDILDNELETITSQSGETHTVHTNTVNNST